MKKDFTDRLGDFIFCSRWLIYPINIGLVMALALYIVRFLVDDYHFFLNSHHLDLEAIMVTILGLVDAFMVANLLTMIIQGSHQIFVKRFDLPGKDERPQWLDHVDSGILKVKVALSIAGITLVQILKDFVNIEQTPWDMIVHRMYIHAMCLLSALIMAIIWRVTHPKEDHEQVSRVPAHTSRRGASNLQLHEALPSHDGQETSQSHTA
jgi:uncharacterized protein (TIGR00645 family)